LGAGLNKQMAKDLKSELPGVNGFSQSNLYVMRKFYLLYHNAEILQQPAGILETRLSEDENKLLRQAAGILSSDSILVKISWWHLQVILSNCKHEKDALFYLQQTIFNNWCRNVLQIQIKSNLFQRQGKSINNFKHTLPKPQSDLERETLKDPSKEYLHRAQPSASQPHSCFVWYRRLVPIPKHNVAGSICLLLGQNEMVAKKLFN
jgi:hypothetical protein